MKLRERWNLWRDRLPSLSDLAFFLGVGLAAKGGADTYAPLGWIIPGLALIAWAILWERAQ